MSLAVIHRELRAVERSVAHLQSIRRGGDPISGRRPRIGAGRTHKASNAESILRHALRRLGWSRQWRAGELTVRQLLRLLDAIRQYGRAWLRHEAEQFFREYGVQVDENARFWGVAERNSLQANGPIESTSRSLATAMQHHVGRFFGRVKGFVRELILAGTMAISGPEPLDADDLAAIDQQAQVQVAYLDRFEREVAAHTPPEIAIATAPPDPQAMSAAQFIDRAEKYAGSTWGASINRRRQKLIWSGRFKEERRVHLKPMNQHAACSICEAESAKGWQPIGTLNAIGDSECLGIHCDCYFEYRNP